MMENTFPYLQVTWLQRSSWHHNSLNVSKTQTRCGTILFFLIVAAKMCHKFIHIKRLVARREYLLEWFKKYYKHKDEYSTSAFCFFFPVQNSLDRRQLMCQIISIWLKNLSTCKTVLLCGLSAWVPFIMCSSPVMEWSSTITSWGSDCVSMQPHVHLLPPLYNRFQTFFTFKIVQQFRPSLSTLPQKDLIPVLLQCVM